MNIKRFIFNPFGESTYLVWDTATGDGVVVDPGMATGAEEREFDRFVAQHNIRINQIINTHLHLDHCWGNNYVVDKYGVKTSANLQDDFLGDRAADQARMFGIGGGEFKPVHIDVPLTDGDIIKVGSGELKVLEVPGHSPGSIALYDAADGWVIVGDALFAGAVGRTDLPGGDFPTLARSIRAKLYSLPGATTVYPGHEQTTTIAREKASNPYVKG